MANNDITVLQEQSDGSLKELALNSSARTLLTSDLAGVRSHLSFFSVHSNFANFPATGEVNRVYVASDTGRIYSWSSSGSAYGELSSSPTELIAACSDEVTALTAGVKVRFLSPHAFTLTRFGVSVTTAPTGSNLVIDVLRDGQSIFAANDPKLQIPAGQTKYFATPSNHPNMVWNGFSQESQISVQIIQAGTLERGRGLKLYLFGQKS